MSLAFAKRCWVVFWFYLPLIIYLSIINNSQEVHLTKSSLYFLMNFLELDWVNFGFGGPVAERKNRAAMSKSGGP